MAEAEADRDDLKELEASAKEAHLAGQAENAADLFTKLGNRLQAQNRFKDAIAAYEAALASIPDFPRAMSNMGVAYARLGQMDEALTWLRKAFECDPGQAASFRNLSETLRKLGRTEELLSCLQRYNDAHPGDAKIITEIATLLENHERFVETIPWYEELLRLDPNNAYAWNNLAATLKDLGRFEEALDCLDRAEALHRQETSDINRIILINQGLTYLGFGKPQPAYDSLRKAHERYPHDLAIQANLAAALGALNRFDESYEIFSGLYDKGALTVDLAISYAGVLMQLEKIDRALAIYEKLIVAQPGLLSARYRRSYLLLLLGQFHEGWEDYQHRWMDKHYASKNKIPPYKLWQGEPPEPGNTPLLVFKEQGFGDMIQLARYIPVLAARGYTVLFEVQPALHSIMAESLSSALIEILPGGIAVSQSVNACVGIFSLPFLLGMQENPISATVPYLRISPARQAQWASRLGPRSGKMRVGLVWSGNVDFSLNKLRSVPVAMLKPILDIPGIEFYALQKGPAAEEGNDLPMVSLGNELQDFEDTGAVLELMDLLITVDTSVAHLAGALNRPAWIMLGKVPDWRWGLSGDTSSWYPSMHIFRQRERGEWDDVIQSVTAALASHVARMGGESS